LNHIQGLKQAEGWHPIQIAGTGTSVDNKKTGIYFVRFMVDGQSLSVKRVVIIK
jgi:hypothetical protein